MRSRYMVYLHGHHLFQHCPQVLCIQPHPVNQINIFSQLGVRQVWQHIHYGMLYKYINIFSKAVSSLWQT